MNQELEEKIKLLGKTLNDKLTAINQLIQITDQEKKSILSKQIEQFTNLVKEKENIIASIANIENDIEEVITLCKTNQDTITETTKTYFFDTIDKVTTLLSSWETKEKENMQLAQTYKISIEKNITKVKKTKNVVNAYKSSHTPPSRPHFDKEG